MFGSARAERLEMEVLSLRASLNHLIDITNHMMVLLVDHPEYEAQAKYARQLLAGRGYRIARDRKAVSDAEELQEKLKVMAEDSAAVAEMLAKKGK